MSFTERAGLIPVLLLTGCAQQTVYTGPPSESVVDSMLTRSAADISAMQYRVHQTGPAAKRPTSPSTKLINPIPANVGVPSQTIKRTSGPLTAASQAGPPNGFIRQAGAAPTLRAALRQIIPPGNTVVFDKEAFADTPELWRWTGNDRWQYVADKMLMPHGLKVTVNDKNHTVTVEPAQRAQAKPVAATSVVAKPMLTIVQVKSTALEPVKTTSSQPTGRNPFSGDKRVASSAPLKQTGAPGLILRPSSVSTPAMPVVQRRSWRIETGNTVKDWLYSQASAETCNVPGIKNWTVAWLTTTNYRVDAPLNFDGSFREMLNKLFTLYGTAKVPLYAGIRATQCVVSVDDKEVQ